MASRCGLFPNHSLATQISLIFAKEYTGNAEGTFHILLGVFDALCSNEFILIARSSYLSLTKLLQ